MFEIREKDMAARNGVLITSRGKVKTPTLMPVVNPNRLTLPVDILAHCGAEMIITNAYILLKTQKEDVIAKGVHELLGFDGPIMTDSGAFQLMIYGDIDVTNEAISRFQERIGVDFGVFLDIPQAKGSEAVVEKALSETIARAKENVSIRQSENTKWVGPIQGGPFPELVAKASKIMGSLPFDIHALGSVVPLMEAYEFATVVRMILAAKNHLPPFRPFHLFGGGHPMFFSLAALCGVDLFDSAAYALYAKSGRYITPTGTLHLESMSYFPCSCEICLGTTPKEMLSIEKQERQALLAQHNLLVSFQEIKTIQQAIVDGRLLDLVHSRSVIHPRLLKALKHVLQNQNYSYFEKYEPVTKKKALFVANDLISGQPFIIRIRKRLNKRFYAWSKILRVTQEERVPPNESNEQIVIFSPVFGLVPAELTKTYPFYQNIAGSVDTTTAENTAKEFLAFNAARFEKVIIEPGINIGESKFGQVREEDSSVGAIPFSKDYTAFRAMLDFQFGRDAGCAVQKALAEFSSKTNVLRRFVNEDRDLLATVRARDFFLIPSILLARKLHKGLKFPLMRVIVTADADPFLRDGRDAFSKFVSGVDPSIRAGDEVIVVNESDELLATGKAVQCAEEMLSFSSGVAVKARRGIERE